MQNRCGPLLPADIMSVPVTMHTKTNSSQSEILTLMNFFCVSILPLCLKKHPQYFLAVTYANVVRFEYFWHKCYTEIRKLKGGLFSHLT